MDGRYNGYQNYQQQGIYPPAGVPQGYGYNQQPGYNQAPGYNGYNAAYPQQAYAAPRAGSHKGKEITGMVMGISALACALIGFSLSMYALSWAGSHSVYAYYYSYASIVEGVIASGVWGLILSSMGIAFGIVALVLKNQIYNATGVIAGKIKVGGILGLIGLISSGVCAVLNIIGISVLAALL
ncbi:MAG: hypothetical protein IKI20_02635 [Lachnospiraceae bacterium]|nr:hypothetical protein [Lachnospiraceae bacterium]